MKTVLLIFILAFANYANAQKMTTEQYFTKAKYIWENFVPESGQAAVVQGELLRAVEKLRDEAQRNGNGNFNKKCHGILIDYVKRKLSDRQIFDTKTIRKINEDLQKLNRERRPYLEDDVYDYLSDRIVDWYLFYGDTIKHTYNNDLKC